VVGTKVTFVQHPHQRCTHSSKVGLGKAMAELDLRKLMQAVLSVHVLLLLNSSKIIIINHLNIVYIIWEKSMVSTKL
jgi:hypothetical protein